MKKLLMIVCCLALLPVSAQATKLALDFNDESAEVRLDVPIVADEYGKALIGGRYLYNDDEDTRLGSLEFKFTGEPGMVPGLEVGAGFIGYVGQRDLGLIDVDFRNVGVGVMAEYAPGQLHGLGFSARIVYSPSIFSWEDSDGLTEFNTRVSYAITPKIKVYGGYQRIELELDPSNQDIDVDDDVRAGLMVLF